MATFGSSSSSNKPPDYNVPQAGNDGISSLIFSPNSNYLVSTNWDGGIRCWECQSDHNSQQVQAIPKAQVNHENQAPVLSSCFSSDGTTVFSGGADKAVRMWSLASQAPNSTPPQIGVHDSPVKSVAFLSTTNLVVSGGWDKKLKFWDARSPNPVGTLDLPERCYDMDCKGELLVVACANRKMMTYDVRGNPVANPMLESQLKFQTRCITAFPDKSGYAVGSIEGRVGVQYISKMREKDSFAFKCHRHDKQAYAVNAICFNRLGTLATVGADGAVTFWDKDNKQRLKNVTSINRCISCANFNANADIFAYAASYDWGKGSSFYAQGHANEIFLHYTPEDDIKPNKRNSRRNR